MELTDWLLVGLGVVGSIISWLFNRTIQAHDADVAELKAAHISLGEKREKDLEHIFGKLSQCVDGQVKLAEEIHKLHRTLLENYVRRDDLAETTRRFESAVKELANDLGERITELKEDIRAERRMRQ